MAVGVCELSEGDEGAQVVRKCRFKLLLTPIIHAYICTKTLEAADEPLRVVR